MNLLEFITSSTIEVYLIFIMLFCYKRISNKELVINKKNIFYIIIFSVIFIMNNLYCIIYYRLLISIVLSILLNKIIFKSTFKESFYYTIIYFMVSFIIELLLVPVVSILDMENIALFNKEYIIKHIFSICLSIVTLIAFYNRVITLNIEKLLDTIKNRVNFLNILIITVVFLNIITILITKNLDNGYLIMLSMSSLLFIVVTYKIMINDKYNILELKMFNKNLKQSYKAYSKTIDECRELKHNLRNDLIAIKSIIPVEYKDSINELLFKYNKRYNWISKIDDMPEGIQGVIYLKSTEAKKKKINMYIDISGKMQNINKDYFSLSSVLSILLDNAIENSAISKEKVITVILSNSKNCLNIEITNTFSNNIDLERIGSKNYSTKEEKSGIGLDFIKRLNKKNIKVKYKIIGNLFKTIIIYHQ